MQHYGQSLLVPITTTKQLAHHGSCDQGDAWFKDKLEEIEKMEARRMNQLHRTIQGVLSGRSLECGEQH